MKDALNSISICLTDIPKDKIQIARNGKMYINLTVAGRKEPDNYGNDLNVYVTPTKEERESKADRIYVGQGKYFEFNKSPENHPFAAQTANVSPEMAAAGATIVPDVTKDDLPF